MLLVLGGFYNKIIFILPWYLLFGEILGNQLHHLALYFFLSFKIVVRFVAVLRKSLSYLMISITKGIIDVRLSNSWHLSVVVKALFAVVLVSTSGQVLAVNGAGTVLIISLIVSLLI